MAKKKTVTNSTSKKIGWVGFIGEANQEIKKVSWPTRKYVSSAAVIILIIVLSLSALVTALDWGFTKIINLMIG